MSQPVLFHGSEAIRTLCEQVNVFEAGISSHWVDMHVVNIIRTLIVDLSFIQTALPDIGIALPTDNTGFDHAMNDDRVAVIALKADDDQLFQGARVNLAVNIASMQEVNPPTIANCFPALRQESGEPIYVYWCNREDKYLQDGTSVRFDDYH